MSVEQSLPWETHGNAQPCSPPAVQQRAVYSLGPALRELLATPRAGAPRAAAAPRPRPAARAARTAGIRGIDRSLFEYTEISRSRERRTIHRVYLVRRDGRFHRFNIHIEMSTESDPSPGGRDRERRAARPAARASGGAAGGRTTDGAPVRGWSSLN